MTIPTPRPYHHLLAGFALLTVAAALPSAVAAQTVEPAPVLQTNPSAPVPISATPGSDALATQPAQRSLSDLVGTSDGLLRVDDRPTLVFSFEEQSVLSPREQIEQNKPENSNAIHFPLGER